jgi:hypothetical protein
VERKRKYGVAFWLTAIPGLIGVFGLGHLYIGEKLRAYAFLCVTALLVALVLWAFLAPATLPALVGAPIMPAIWFLGWVAAMYDIRKAPLRRLREVASVERSRVITP